MFLRFIQSNNLRALFFYALILFLPTQFGKHFWPSFSFIEGIRVDYLSPTLYVTDILAILFILFSLQTIKLPKIIFPVLLFLSLGVFFSQDPFAGWYQMAKFVEFLLLGLSVKTIVAEQDRKIIVGILLGCGIIFETFLAGAQFFLRHSVGGIFYFLGERTFSSTTPGIANASINGQLVLRPYGTLPHPNVLAGFLLVALFLIIGFLGKEKNLVIRLFTYMVAVAAVVGVFLTFSRIAIVLLVISGLGFMAKKKLQKKKQIIIAIGLLALILGMLFFTPLFFERFFFSISDETIVQRKELFVAAVQMIGQHPILGVGFGNFFTSVAGKLPKASFFLFLQPVHNIFLLLAATGGLPFLGFVMWFLWKTWKLLTLKNLWYGKILPLTLATIVVLGQVDHYFVTIQQGQLLTTLVLGLSWSLIDKASSS